MRPTLINLAPIKALVKEKLMELYNTTTYINTDEINLRLSVKEYIDSYIANKNLEEPRVCMTTDAYTKMRLLVDKNTSEIGWYGTVEALPAINTYIINDIIVYPQLVSGVTCEQNEDKMFEFELGLTTEQVNTKRFQGHSHVNMATLPSGVDESFYQDLLTQVNDYFIVTITNKRDDYTTRFYDVANNILYRDIEIELIDSQGFAILDWYEEQTKLVETKVAHVEPPSLLNNPYDDYDPDPNTFYRGIDYYNNYKKGKKKK